MSEHEQVPFNLMVETREEFRKGWRKLDLEIAFQESLAKNGTRAERPEAARKAESLKHEIHDLILDELKFHLAGQGYKLRTVSDYATVANAALLEIKLLLPAEAWKGGDA